MLSPVMAQRADPNDVAGSDVPSDGLLEGLLCTLGRGSEDEERLRAAYAFAHGSHGAQMRASGEAFIAHPVAVAGICAGLGLDTTTLCAALLHDTVEDTTASLEEVEARFGPQVAGLVDGVTKLSTLSFSSRDEAQAESYRKMMLAMAVDVRVILIKLADRLHNMRTIAAVEPDRQRAKAVETLEVYAPLAHRLGVQSIRCELEDLSFAVLEPTAFAEMEALVAEQRQGREAYVASATSALAEALGQAGIEAALSGRYKHLYSIHAKMGRKGRSFDEIHDLMALRVICETVADCYGALGVAHTLWTPLPGRFKDFIAVPKPNMYQSLHTTVLFEGAPLEVQMRTPQMHETAEHGVAAHWSYKRHGSGAPASQEERMGELRSMLDWEGDPEAFLESLRTTVADEEVYAFTPQGDVKALSAGATPLDFAYAVHTEVGHRCAGARVNGRMVPLATTLRSGDIVEILTSRTDKLPSRDWLAIAQTSRARGKIRQRLKATTREEDEAAGRVALTALMRSRRPPAHGEAQARALKALARRLGFSNADDLHAALGSGRLTTQQVLAALDEEAGARAQSGPKTPQPVRPTTQGQRVSGEAGIVVEGSDEVMLRLARCCRPAPGDEIIGYVSLGRGVAIHRADCPNAKDLGRNPERLVPVSWSDEPPGSFAVGVEVEGQDRPRLLEDLSRACVEAGARIIEAQAASGRGGLARCTFTVEVASTDALEAVLVRLRAVDAVQGAWRMLPRGAQGS
jgi:GTP pyrophosphokinase